MWVTPGASTARTCSSSISDPSSSANSRSPSPRRTGANEISISSSRPARRYCRITLAPPVSHTSFPPAFWSGPGGWWGMTKTGRWWGGSHPTSLASPPPRTGPTAEHVPTHDDGADVLPPASNHGGARVDLAPAAILAVHLAEDGERHDPVVEALATDAEGILHALVRAGHESVQRHRHGRSSPPTRPGDMVPAHDSVVSTRRSSGAVRSPPSSPVFGVPNGSINRSWHSSEAFGQCSTPLATTKRSPGPSSTSPSRICMVNRPAITRKSSSVSSCLCQTQSPWTLTSCTL